MSDRWIDEQKKLHGKFKGLGHNSDAYALLTKGPQNLFIASKEQGEIFACMDIMGDRLGIGCFTRIRNRLEDLQLCINKDSRKDFMRVAIEQWQGKLANLKKRAVENMGDNL